MCIATGNHDFYTPGGLWDTVAWPENVHIFRAGQMEAVEIPALGAVVHGAAFTGPEQAESLLAGFSAPADGCVHLGVLHGVHIFGQAAYKAFGAPVCRCLDYGGGYLVHAFFLDLGVMGEVMVSDASQPASPVRASP